MILAYFRVYSQKDQYSAKRFSPLFFKLSSNTSTQISLEVAPSRSSDGKTSTKSDSPTSSIPPSITISVVQQPIHCRMSGFNAKDVRPIDPPPVVKISVSSSSRPPSFEYLICHVSLWSADQRNEVLESSRRKPRLESPLPVELLPPLLVGDRVSICHRLFDESKAPGLYFVFPEVAIKCVGVFCLQFQVFDLQR